MDCTDARELLSARLDGELGPEEAPALDAHLLGCAACAARAAELGDAHRVLRLHEPLPVPDLSSAIVERHLASARPRTGALDATRVALFVVGMTQLLLALPELLFGRGESAVHTEHDLGAWTVAFAFGLLLVAAQPDRARGLLPMAAALVVIMAITVGLDLSAGRATLADETAHLFEAIGLALLVAASRWSGPPARVGRPPLLGGGPRVALR